MCPSHSQCLKKYKHLCKVSYAEKIGEKKLKKAESTHS